MQKPQITMLRIEIPTDLYINWNSHAPFQWKSGNITKIGENINSHMV